MNNEKIRKVFTNNLPQRKGKNHQIDWKKSIGYKVKGVYDDLKFEIIIIDYIKSKILIQYKNKKPYKISTSNFLNCQLSELLGLVTNEFKIEIGQTFKDDKRNITIIDRKYKDNPYDKGKQLKYYKYRCNKCGFECGEHYKNEEYQEEYWITESSLVRGNGCACCCPTPRIVVPGINDIPTTAPWMVKYFQGGYNEAKLYTKSSGKKVQVKCPECGKIKDKPIKISVLYKNHSIGCIYCGDGISYPEKFMLGLLKQLNINFEYHKTFKWSNKKEYDFYIPNKKVIIETDGAQHKKNKSNGSSWDSLQKQTQNDTYKDKMAQDNKLCIIRIDCEYSNLIYIKNNILNSKLNDLFDLSKIDWNKCEEFALTNLIKKASDLWNNGIVNTKNIAINLNISRSTVINYLKIASTKKWCNYNPKEEMKKVRKKKKKKGIPVEIFKNDESLGKFPSIAELERQSENLFGIKLDTNQISATCLGKYKYYKGFTFKYIN